MALESSSLNLKTIIGVDAAIMNMTPEQEVERYGTVDDFVSSTLKRWEAEFDCFHSYEFPVVRPIDLIWKGWDAAYIESKGQNDCQGATLESTGLNHAIGEHLKRVYKKRKFSDFSRVHGTEEKESPEVSVEIPLEERNEFAVTLLATQVMHHFWGWYQLESLPEIDGKALRERVFDCAVKFVLSIFDEEDFYRICHACEIKDEHMDFCYGHANTPVSFEDLSPNKFSYLCEPDIYLALHEVEAHQDKAREADEELLDRQPIEAKEVDEELLDMQPIEFHEICAYSQNFLKPCFRLSDVARALELMQNHRPLKGYLKAQLILEMSREKCFHVLDTLTLEAINGMNLPKYDIIQNFVWKDKDDDNREYPDFLLTMTDGIVSGLEYLSTLKADESLKIENALIESLAKKFGPFKDEVSEVMKRANHERRIGNCRFIGLVHIWVALSFSRVRNMLIDIARNHLCSELSLLDGTSELYTFRLFTLSRLLASNFGHEKLGLEHLVFSIVYGSSQNTLMKNIQHEGLELFESLAKCESDSGVVESWRNIEILTIVSDKRCRIGMALVCRESDLVKKLQESLESGRLVLPKYEDLRVM